METQEVIKFESKMGLLLISVNLFSLQVCVSEESWSIVWTQNQILLNDSSLNFALSFVLTWNPKTKENPGVWNQINQNMKLFIWKLRDLRPLRIPLTLITMWSHSINVGRSCDFFIDSGTCYIFIKSSTCS